MDNIGARIKQIRTAAGLSQVNMAKKIGIGQSTLAQMETGRRTVAERYIMLLASAFNVNPDWIKTGKGSIYKPAGTSSGEQILSPTKKALIAAITALPDNQCDALAAAAAAAVEQLTYANGKKSKIK